MKKLFLLIASISFCAMAHAQGTSTKEVTSRTTDPSGAACALSKVYINTTAPGSVWVRIGGVCTRIDGIGAAAAAWGTITGTLSSQTDLQTALNLKSNNASPTFTGTVTIPTPFTLGAVSVLPTGTELNFVDGVTSAIQTQLNSKSTLTNSAGANVVPKSDGTNLVASRIADDGTIINVNSESVVIGDIDGAGSSTKVTIDDGTQTVVSSKTFRAPLIEPTSAGADAGSATLPFGSVYVGAAATNNIQLTGTATGARVATLPDATTKIPIAAQTITFAGPTAARTYTFPDAAATIARTDAGQTFTGNEIFTGPIINMSGSANLGISASLSAIQLGGNTVIDNTTARAAGSNFAIRWNNYFDGTNSKYISTDLAVVLTMGSGAATFYTAPSGTAGNNATITSRFGITNTGGLTASSGITDASGTPGSLCYNTSTFEFLKNDALTCTVSARSQKLSVAPFTFSALSLIDKVQPVQFAYRDAPSRMRWGFIADDVALVDRKLADGYDAKGSPQSLDQNAILSLTIAALKELTVRVQALEKENQELKQPR